MRVVRTAGGTNSITCTLVSASWMRRLSLNEWIAALVALYVGVAGSGTKASPEETLTMAASSRSSRCGSSAWVIRSGPSRLVLTVCSDTLSQSGP